MSDTKCKLLWLALVIWGITTLAFPVRAQEVCPVQFTEPKCSDRVELAHAIPVHKKMGTSHRVTGDYGGFGGSVPAGGAPPAGGAIGTITHDDVSAVGITGLILFTPQVPSTAGTVSYGHIYLTAQNGANVGLIIYSSTGTQLAYGCQTLSGTATGWVNIALNTSVVLGAATTYWPAFIEDTDLAIGRAAGSTHYADDTGYSYACPTGNLAGDDGEVDEYHTFTIYFDNNSGNPS